MMDTSVKRPKFSVVITLCDEEQNIPELYRRLTAVIDGLCGEEGFAINDYEMIMVDDGSRDRSWQLIGQLHEEDPRVRGLRLSRNFGQHIAIAAGLDHADGEAIITMDGDLQDSPEEIPKLWKKFKEGYELVYGIRKENRSGSSLKDITSLLFWWLINKLSGRTIPRNQATLRMFDSKILDVLKRMKEQNRFFHGMMAWTGFRTFLQEVEHAPRGRGNTKYNFAKSLKLGADAITSLSIVPLALAGYIGLISAGAGVIAGAYVLCGKIFFGIPMPTNSLIIILVLFMGGVQLLFLGILGGYLGRIYREVQKRPLYIVNEQI